jgi:hypothetical protein
VRGEGAVFYFAVAPTTLETIFTRALTVGCAAAPPADAAAAAVLPWAQRGWEHGVGGSFAAQVAANVAWLTLGLGALPLALGALFTALATVFCLPLYPIARYACRRLAIMAAPFSPHPAFFAARGARRPPGCHPALVEGLAWLVVGLPTAGAHLLCAAVLAASVVGLPLAMLHARLAALNLSFRWVLPKMITGRGQAELSGPAGAHL